MDKPKAVNLGTTGDNCFINGGFIPYSTRPQEIKKAFGHIRDAIPCYSDLFPLRGDLPKRVIFAEAERKCLGGQLLPRCRQVTGSCVGAATLWAWAMACVLDVLFRKSGERIPKLFPFAPWGFSRYLAGMRGPGEGSFGGAMKDAGLQMGLVEIGTDGVPNPTGKSFNGKTSWLFWTERQEFDWSWPANWPVPVESMKATGKKTKGTVRIQSVEEYRNAAANGIVPTIASSAGTDAPRIVGDALISDWTTTWLHQQAGGGYFESSQAGPVYPINNQWGDYYKKPCPTLGPLGVDGTVSVTEKTLERILRDDDTECWGFYDTENFSPIDPGQWDSVVDAFPD